MCKKVVPDTTRSTFAGLVESNIDEGTMVSSDDAAPYARLPRLEVMISHCAGEYIRQQRHINGVESFCSTMERAQNGVYHKFSPKQLDRYVDEFSGRHNLPVCQHPRTNGGHRSRTGRKAPHVSHSDGMCAYMSFVAVRLCHSAHVKAYGKHLSPL